MIEPEQPIDQNNDKEILSPAIMQEQETIPSEEIPFPEAPEDQPAPEFIIASFWRRVAAFTIDMIILAIPLLIFGFLFSRLTYRLGPWGRLIGFGLMLIYWTLMSSATKNGQTIGKRIMKTAVVDKNGRFLPTSKSFLRSLILVLILLFNGWAIAILQWTPLAIITSILVFGGILTMLYGLIFNRTTRQGIHDLISHTYVIKTPPSDTVAPTIPTIHKNITIALIIIVFVFSIFASILPQTLNVGPFNSAEFRNMRDLQAVLHDSAFFNIGVQQTTRWTLGESDAFTTVSVQAWAKESCQDKPVTCQLYIDQLAQTMLENKDDIDSLSGMSITVYNRFDLGFANGQWANTQTMSIDDWRNHLQKQ